MSGPESSQHEPDSSFRNKSVCTGAFMYKCVRGIAHPQTCLPQTCSTLGGKGLGGASRTLSRSASREAAAGTLHS